MVKHFINVNSNYSFNFSLSSQGVLGQIQKAYTFVINDQPYLFGSDIFPLAEQYFIDGEERVGIDWEDGSNAEVKATSLGGFTYTSTNEKSNAKMTLPVLAQSDLFQVFKQIKITQQQTRSRIVMEGQVRNGYDKVWFTGFVGLVPWQNDPNSGVQKIELICPSVKWKY